MKLDNFFPKSVTVLQIITNSSVEKTKKCYKMFFNL